ncbi:MAG: hypothetical protein DME06_13700 [Candidatus Rokuibacteriota bacterium]|nr:MAG: hypothetical protein DME06_13700 [Candidatus Rokubacteria bacterium]
MDVERIREQYRQSGMVGRVGFGTTPAIVVVDFITGLTDPRYPLGAGMDAEVLATRRLLDAGRAAAVLIVFMTVAYEPHLRDAGLFIKKAPGLRHQILGTPAVAVDERLAREPGEPLLVKKFQSSFFGTPLASILTAAGVDTCIIAPEPHLANLLDMDSKIADVVSLEETIAYLAALAAKPERAPAVAQR